MPTPTEPTSSVVQTAATVRTVAELAALLRLLRRREARHRDGAVLTYRELAARTGWSHAIIGEYLAGTALPPTDRFDQLIQILGATRVELGALATARDRVEELRRPRRAAPASGPAGGANLQRVPRELPAPVAGFVGRRDALAELDRIAGAGDAATGLSIAAICGVGGVGKTALARQWAHHRAADFPDGQLYIDLCGFSSRPPVSAAEALSRFLQALGVEPSRIPATIDERASRYRTALAGRRVLVVLDNAQSAEHVRPLLPGGVGSLVVVTSRDSLAGLVAADGAQRIPLDVLTEDESVQVLRTFLMGRHDDLAALARPCAGLPLALRVVGELAAAQPDAPLAELVADLVAEGRPALLDAGDGATVRSVLSWSYARLSPPAARLFRLFGTDPGPDCAVAAVASLAGLRVATARHLLAELTRAHLLGEVAPGRYAPHAVLRAYARDLFDHDVDEDRRLTVHRLLDHYVHTAALAHHVLHPHRAPVDLADAAPGVVVAELPTVAAAQAWLDAERRSLHAAARLANRHGFAEHARQLHRMMHRGATPRDLRPVTTALSGLGRAPARRRLAALTPAP